MTVECLAALIETLSNISNIAMLQFLSNSETQMLEIIVQANNIHFLGSFLTLKIEMLYLLDLGGGLKHKPLAIAVGVDTAENGTSKVGGAGAY